MGEREGEFLPMGGSETEEEGEREGEFLPMGGSEAQEEGEREGEFLPMPMGGIGGEGEREDIGSSDGREKGAEGDVLPHCRCLCGAQD